VRWLLLALMGCGTPQLDLANVDPETCGSCHPSAYKQWSGSMHAYASEDPVFRAMNARGQRETNGELGDFCIQCHAPLAVEMGYTTDGLNLDEVPDEVKGVSCAFCHSVDDVVDDHNNGLKLALSGTFLGGILYPESNPVHASSYSPHLDEADSRSSDTCGSCHDIVNTNGVHLERTYVEWQESMFNDPDPSRALGCVRCHMPGSEGEAAALGPQRQLHDHSMPGVDLALTPWPEMEAQRALVELELSTVVATELCVQEPESGRIANISFENIGAGHSFPSGAVQDRDVWAEVVAWRGDEEILRDTSIRFGDKIYNQAGEEVHMFWEAYSNTSELLPAPTTLDPTDLDWIPTHVWKAVSLPDDADRVEVRMFVRPMRRVVLEDLVASGDLDPVILDAMPVFEVDSAHKVWSTGDPDCIE